jgi:hypothetical protein
MTYYYIQNRNNPNSRYHKSPKNEPVLPRIPSAYGHLGAKHEKCIKPSNIHPRPDSHFPRDLRRTMLLFAVSPFPHFETKVDGFPDFPLKEMQNDSKKRRDPLPRTGTTIVREQQIPTILDPLYPVYQSRHSRQIDMTSDNSPIIPLPSMLHKPMQKSEYIDRMKSMNGSKSNPSTAASHTRPTTTRGTFSFLLEPRYTTRGFQPDFSDLDEKLLIQKSVPIYMMQKPEKKHYLSKKCI